MTKWLEYLFGAVVLGTMVLAFVLTGTPGENRLKQRDKQRVSDLNVLRNEVIEYKRREETAPISLASVLAWCEKQAEHRCINLRAIDAADYEFNRRDDKLFELCTTFEGAVTLAIPTPPAGPHSPSPSSHGAGRHCYTYEFKD